MRSDEITMPKPEFISNDGSGVRLLAYSYAICGKDSNGLSSTNGKPKSGTGITGLMKELEKTKLDV